MANKTNGSNLQRWRVVYQHGNSGDNLVFRCEADDITHAIEQCTDSEPGCAIWAR